MSTAVIQPMVQKLKWSPLQKLCLVLFKKYLQRWREGAIEVTLPDGSHFLVDSGDGSEPVEMHIHDLKFFNQLIFEGDVGMGRAYSLGMWSSPDVTRTLFEFNRNFKYGSDDGYALTVLGEIWQKLFHKFRKNSLTGSKKNIGAHYDLGNELYKRFLDDNMVYSCAYFGTEKDSLEEAQTNKVNRLIDMAEVKPTDHVLEIGSGWGHLAITLAKEKGCKVTTITLSEEQYAHVQEKIAEQGLENQIDVRLQDYRTMQGKFDKIISVEMIEAVGHEFLKPYFDKCRSLLNPHGKLVIQAITLPDDQYHRYRKNCDFIQRYIFPGACVPSKQILEETACDGVGFSLTRADNIGPHYAETLKIWREKFKENWNQIKIFGYDEYFYNMWNYYLHYCEAGFRTRYLGTYQMQFSLGAK